MIKTLNPYANTAKTAEIMSRYRPIAPKPEAGPTSPTGSGGGGGGDSASASASAATSPSQSQKIKQSPYLRNLWPQMQARPTRTRKRGARAALSPPASAALKRQRTMSAAAATLGISPPPCHVAFMGFSHGLQHPHHHHHHHHQQQQQISINPNLNLAAFEFNKTSPTTGLVTLPLLPCPQSTNPINAELDNWLKPSVDESSTKLIDLNKVASHEVPEEKDLLQQLQRLVPIPAQTVIAPQPVRPVGSTIRVRCISEDSKQPSQPVHGPKKRPEEVEAEVESEALPAVISDSNNKVRMANSAYKELVGQPECAWLGSMVASSSCKRIGGEVVLRLADGGSRLPAASLSSGGFSCWVRIEWGGDGGKKNSVNAFCDVIRLACESKDYVFTWRFHTREASQSSCNA